MITREKKIFTIREITRYLKMKIEQDPVLAQVWVRGEISNFKRHSSGHLYFTLKDADSRLKCVMFSSRAGRLPFRPGEGMQVLAQGAINIYERDGSYQLYVEAMQPDGVGGLYLAYEQLKTRLSAEGLFAAQRKQALPRMPRAVGVVTSPTGAAVRDVLTTIERRYPGMPVVLYPALVQGAGAAASVARGIELMNAYGGVDLLIVGRGGGSLEELWAFNEEIVARSIAASRIPVISAVGHETDTTIADFVADVRAATPTAAAELAVPVLADLRSWRAQLTGRLVAAMAHQRTRKAERLAQLQTRAVYRAPERYLLLQQTERFERAHEHLTAHMSRLVVQKQERLQLLKRSLRVDVLLARRASVAGQLTVSRTRLHNGLAHYVRGRRLQWQGLVRSLDALSPLKIMARGYSLVYDGQEQHLLTDSREVAVGDELVVRLAQGKLKVQTLETCLAAEIGEHEVQV